MALPSIRDSEAEIRRILHEEGGLGVVLLDLVALPRVERRFGQAAYQTLRAQTDPVLEELQNRVRKEDLVVRDERDADRVILFMSRRRNPSPALSMSDVRRVADRIEQQVTHRISRLTQPYLREKAAVDVGYGFVVWSPLESDDRQVHRVVDECVASAGLRRRLQERDQRESLVEIVANREIWTAFQPIVEIETIRTVGHEALSRGPRGSDVEPPIVLFGMANRFGLTEELERACRRQAFQDWETFGAPGRLFVNTVPATVRDPSFLGKGVLDYLGPNISPRLVTLEINERQVIENMTLYREAMHSFLDLGFTFAIDDVGAGYSGLETMATLGASYLKIDMGLVRHVHQKRVSQQVIKAIAEMGAGVKATVIAEGIELQEEAEALRALGVRYGQGYFFGRPVDPSKTTFAQVPARSYAMTAPRRTVAGAILAVAALAVYARAFGVPFLFDDLLAIPENPRIRALSTSLASPADTTLAGRPVASLSFALNHAAGGLDVTGYHAVNLVLHVLCAWLVYGVVRRLSRADGPALATALLFTVHPLATEAVVYLVQRTELLMALCLLGTLYAFLRGWYAASVAACAIGMGCKEVMVAAPLVVWIADATFVAGGFGAALRARRTYYAGLVATWGILAFLVFAGGQRHATGLDLDLGVTPLQYLWTQSRAILLYLRLALWPHPLALYYDWKPAASLAAAWPSVAAVTALFLATAYGVARRAPAAFAGAVFFLVLAPTSSVLPIPTELVAERRMYLPLAAVLALVVVGVHRLLVRAAGDRARLVGPAVAGVAAIALGAVAFVRVLDYRTEESIWRDTVAKAPASALVRNNYGRALAALGRHDDAIAQYREGLRLAPEDARTWAKLGNALGEQGKLAEAVDAYRAALRYEPTDEKTHNNLARVLLRVGDLPGAIAHLQEAVRLDPSYALGRLNLAKLLANAGRFREARAQAEAVAATSDAPPGLRAEATALAHRFSAEDAR